MKVAFKIIQNDKEILINEENLKSFIGSAIFNSKRLYNKLPRGVAIGLGFNDYGGSILYVESSRSNYMDKTTGNIKVTGNLGNVMQESCSIALTFVKSFLQNFKESKNLREFFDSQQIHVHFTEGAISKDGPSAGVTIATTLLSLALNKAIVENLAMTGEISLSGKVLPIGGVKEKVMAAQREGMKTLVFPLKNKEDVEELPAYIKQHIKIYYADHYSEIFPIVFPGIAIL